MLRCMGCSLPARKETVCYNATVDGEGRTPVNDEAHIAEIDAARHNAACGPYKAD